MEDSPDSTPTDPDQQLEQEVIRARKFSAAEAMARLAGPGAMKGASPVSPVQQAETEIGTWLANNLVDPDGALKLVLHRQLKGSKPLLENLDKPLVALESCCSHIIQAENLLKELVREADAEWGRAMDERPYFEREGTQPHPHDPYTVETVRSALENLLGLLRAKDD
jgi:hypothetical protein